MLGSFGGSFSRFFHTSHNKHSKATTRSSAPTMFSSSLRRMASTSAAVAAGSCRRPRHHFFASSSVVVGRFTRLAAPPPQHSTTAVPLSTKCRYLSSTTDDSTTTPPPQPQQPATKPPSEINDKMAMGIQDSVELFLNYGVGKQRLEEILTVEEPLVKRWQRMMEAFIGTQVHVLAGLGYTPDEAGLALYNQQLAAFVQSSSPEFQESLRKKGRDTWRRVLELAFDCTIKDEISIVDARNMMHKVSLKMQSPEILEEISKRAASIQKTDNAQMDMALKHQVVQEVLVNQVYLGGEPSLVEECGFASGPEGYVEMQAVMAEHQADPLVAQYIGSAMMKVMEAAGFDLPNIQQAAMDA